MQYLDLPDSTHPSPIYYPSRERPLRDDTATSDDSRLLKWLSDIDGSSYTYQTTHTTSCPPRLEDHGSIVEVTDQLPLLEFLEEISTRTRMGPSNGLYRSVLEENGVQIDSSGKRIPEELRVFLDSHILGKPSPTLSSETIDAIRNLVYSIESKAEDSVYELVSTQLLPITRDGVEKASCLTWNTERLPKDEESGWSITAPKPDIYLGYANDVFAKNERRVVVHPAAVRVTRPTTRSLLPFLVFELKAESTGGTLWHAENLAAGSGSSCVNILRWIFEEAYDRQADIESPITVLDTIAFSVCATHRSLLYHVHYYSDADATFYMSWFATIDTTRDIQFSNSICHNILDYCMGQRLSRIHDALARLHPIPSRWLSARYDGTKKSRPASGSDLGESPLKKSKK
jgi:hypothetical protein